MDGQPNEQTDSLPSQCRACIKESKDSQGSELYRATCQGSEIDDNGISTSDTFGPKSPGGDGTSSTSDILVQKVQAEYKVKVQASHQTKVGRNRQ